MIHLTKMAPNSLAPFMREHRITFKIFSICKPHSIYWHVEKLSWMKTYSIEMKLTRDVSITYMRSLTSFSSVKFDIHLIFSNGIFVPWIFWLGGRKKNRQHQQRMKSIRIHTDKHLIVHHAERGREKYINLFCFFFFFSNEELQNNECTRIIESWK